MSEKNRIRSGELGKVLSNDCKVSKISCDLNIFKKFPSVLITTLRRLIKTVELSIAGRGLVGWLQGK